MNKRPCEEMDHAAAATAITADQSKRLCKSSLAGTDSQILQHRLESDANSHRKDPFEADLEKAIALSLADQDSLPLVSDINRNDRVCLVCKKMLSGVTVEGFNLHVNECLDRGGESSSISSNSDNTSAKESWSRLFRRVPNAFATIMQTTATKKNAKKSVASTSSDGSAQDKKKKGVKRPIPFYKWMQDTPYTVDAFCYGEIDNCKGYFLTHFHSDHYTNLRKSWSYGPIYCSQITANLIQHKIGVLSEYIHPLPMDKEVTMEEDDKVSVTLIDANHCPGAVLFLFKVRLPGGQIARHLHTGDFRANPRMCLHRSLKQPENGPIDTLYLDTTYLHGSFTFPRQALVLQAACDMAERIVAGKDDDENKPATALKIWLKKAAVESPCLQEKSAHGDVDNNTASTTTTPTLHPSIGASIARAQRCSSKVLVVVGTYLIGKEKVFYHIAKRLGTKIYVDDRKRKVIECLEDKELLSMLTSNPFEAQVHAIPIMHLKIEYLASYLEELKPHFTSIIAFRPTGWTFRGGNRADNESRPLAEITAPIEEGKKGSQLCDIKPTTASSRTVRVFGLPYSEHSSFRELALFVSSLQIRRIVPTVNMLREESRARMYAILKDWQQQKTEPVRLASFTSEDGW
ncbi:DNA repair metallo-beta-lactamase-domain-containing protein [Dichotomocladium elegans]|nr:DNA repair metallo-beta-lactamase-domain-containing protein [Dichotomocladium elegans]